MPYPEQQRREAELHAAIEERLGELVNGCLNKPGLSYRAQLNGPPVSALDYLVARVKDAAAGGSATNSPADNLKAAMVAQQLEVVLDAIQASIADGGVRPGDIMRQWGGQLRLFDNAKVAVSTFLTTTLVACYSNAQTVVNRELVDPTTSLGAFRQAALSASH